MKDLVETIAKALVDHPEDVRVNVVEGDRTIIFELSVHASDMGKIIGKQGRIVKSFRTVLAAAAAKEKKRVMLEVV